MTTRQSAWMKKTGYSKEYYVAHLEDALMQACLRIGDSSYDKAKSLFHRYITDSKIDPKTGESIHFLF